MMLIDDRRGALAPHSFVQQLLVALQALRRCATYNWSDCAPLQGKLSFVTSSERFEEFALIHFEIRIISVQS
jgi:hypothetical protein